MTDTTATSDLIDWGAVAEMRQPHATTPPTVRRKHKKHYEQNKDYYVRKAKRWREENPEQSKKYMHAYYLKLKQVEEKKAKRRESARAWHRKFKEQHGVSYETFRRRRLAARRTDETVNDTTPPAPSDEKNHSGR